MSSYTTITSPSHLQTLLSSNEYTLLDFWATWCPPCKAIAPLFDRLASEHSTPGKLAFAKVDVDDAGGARDVAKLYKVSAMPTFLLLRGDEVVKVVRGADAVGLKKVVGYAGKKGRGEEVSEEEEGAYGEVEMGGGGSGMMVPVLLIGFLVWWFFGRGGK